MDGQSRGRITSIAYSDAPGLPRPLHPSAVLRAGHGIEGDHRAGRGADRALNLVEARHLAALAEAGYAIGPGSVGENVVVDGLALDGLPGGTRLRLGDTVVVRLVKARTGCATLAYIHGDFPGVAQGRIGHMCAVDQGGEIRVGDAVTVESAVPEAAGG
jgi:MOSC domain-containing protein YiiM